jgi:hypothetical protein
MIRQIDAGGAMTGDLTARGLLLRQLCELWLWVLRRFRWYVLMLPPFSWILPAPQVNFAGIMALTQIEPPINEYCQECYSPDDE